MVDLSYNLSPSFSRMIFVVYPCIPGPKAPLLICDLAVRLRDATNSQPTLPCVCGQNMEMYPSCRPDGDMIECPSFAHRSRPSPPSLSLLLRRAIVHRRAVAEIALPPRVDWLLVLLTGIGPCKAAHLTDTWHRAQRQAHAVGGGVRAEAAEVRVRAVQACGHGGHRGRGQSKRSGAGIGSQSALSPCMNGQRFSDRVCERVHVRSQRPMAP